MTLDERAKRIVDTAVMLAERDGFAAVRLRDVAATAQVALGTVYKRFGSKEEILIAALEQEGDRMRSRFGRRQLEGDTPSERVVNLITLITRGFCRKPNLARALIRSIASGDPNVTEKVASFHDANTQMIVAAIRGDAAPDTPIDYRELDPQSLEIAQTLQLAWFASLVSWAGGIHDIETVLTHVRSAARLLLGTRG